MKDFKLKDIFYSLLGSIIVVSFLFYITDGGWGELDSSQSPKVIHKQQERTVTEDVLKITDDEYLQDFNIFKEQQEYQKEQLSKTEFNYQTFEVTAYTAGYESTGKTPSHPEYGITKSGAYVKERETIACPPNMEFGTEVYIPYFDENFTCQDRGSKITKGHLDVYMKNVDDALDFGRRDLKVQLITS